MKLAVTPHSAEIIDLVFVVTVHAISEAAVKQNKWSTNTGGTVSTTHSNIHKCVLYFRKKK